MLHIILGTKAQIIKMAPLMVALKEQGVEFSFISTGQHKETIDDILHNFKIRKPDARLYEGRDVVSVVQMLIWSIRVFVAAMARRAHLFHKYRNNIIVVHGDTVSAVVGAVIGKCLRFKVAHVESGLRSFNLWNPFPEEILRIMVFYLADIYFCPGQRAIDNICSHSGEKVNTEENTIIDSVRAALKADVSEKTGEQYVVMSLHRYENFSSHANTLRIVECIEQIAANQKVIFILHQPTERSLKRYGLYERIKRNRHIELRPRCDYFSFVGLLRRAHFVVSDGGSNQEECSYLGVPTLLLRKVTEREDGIGVNVLLSNLEPSKIAAFMASLEQYRRPPRTVTVSPSTVIALTLMRYEKGSNDL